MMFETVRDAIVSMLDAGSGSNYIVTGAQKQSVGADENVTTPRVTVYTQEMEPDEKSSSRFGPYNFTHKYRLEFLVVTEAKVDLSVLNDASATPSELQAALATMPDVSYECSKALDTLIRNVFQVVMAANNYDLDLDIGEAVDRWMHTIQKDPAPVPRGEYVIMTGGCLLTYRVTEDSVGDTPISGDDIDITVDIRDDLGNNAGTKTEL